jgi:spore germination protein (amino acid permease)
MNKQPGTLGIREFIAIAVLMVGAKATEDTPAFLYSQLQNASWMIPILSVGMICLPIYLLLKTMSVFQDKNLFSVIQKLFGKYIGFVVCLLILFISSYAITFDTRSYTNIIRSYYFTTTPHIIIYAVLMFTCAYGAKKGIQNVGSVSYLIVFFSILSLYLALLISTQESNLNSIFPIWGPGKMEIVKNSSLNLTIFAEFFILAMLRPYMSSTKEFKRGTWIALFYIAIQISVAVFIYICMFDISLSGMDYPFHSAIRYISLGTYLPNIEIIFFILWVMSAFIRFAAFLYINALMFGQIFKIKDYEYLIPSLATIYLLIGIIPETPIAVSLELKPLLRIVAGPTFSAISIMLWLVALLKGEFKHAKNKNSL